MIRILLGLTALLSLMACNPADDDAAERISRQAAYTPFVDIEEVEAEQSAEQPEFAVRTSDGLLPISEDGSALWDGYIRVTFPSEDEGHLNPVVELQLVSLSLSDEDVKIHRQIMLDDPTPEGLLATKFVPFGTCRGQIWWARFVLNPYYHTVQIRLHLDGDRPHLIQATLEPLTELKITLNDATQYVFEATNGFGSSAAGVRLFLDCERRDDGSRELSGG